MAGRIRLTPTLFDKLAHGNALSGISLDDDMPSVAREEFRNFAVSNVERFTESSLRASIRRDLAWLLNTLSFDSGVDMSRHPRAQKSVLNFGVRDFSGRSGNVRALREQARQIRAAIQRFEPRLDPKTLRVEPNTEADQAGKVNFTIEAQVLGGPHLLPVKFRTQMDLETAAIEVTE